MMLCSKVSGVLQSIRQISTTSCLFYDRAKREAALALPKKDEGIQGVDSVELLAPDHSMVDQLTFKTQFNGVPFSDLPILHVKCSMNNTLCTLTQANGVIIVSRSGGTEGFKNSKKGTTVAAQAAATAIAHRAFRYSLKDIRLVIKGLGPGRLASVKSLHAAGLNIVSITDKTPSPLSRPKPRKARRI